jgi:DNA-binding IclR family transcriptional regulator
MQRNYRVPMVEKAFRILETLQQVDDGLCLRDLSSRAGVVNTSAFRILCTLGQLGYVNKDEARGTYALGVKLLELASGAFGAKSLPQIARPFLLELRDRLGETVNLGVLQNQEIIYVDILEGTHPFRMVATIGSRAPIHASALGKSIAAFLPQPALQAILKVSKLARLTPHTITSRSRLVATLARVRKLGYSLDNEEAELAASCVAAPILNAAGYPLAAISVSGPRPRLHDKRPEIIKMLKRTCAILGGQAAAFERP